MDDKDNVGSPDRDRININEDYEVQYWAKRFNVTNDELRESVKAAGTTVVAVQQYLKGK